MNFPNEGAQQVPQNGPPPQANFSARTYEGNAGRNAPEVDLKLAALMVEETWRLQGKFLPVMLAKQVAQEKATKANNDLLQLLIKRQDENFVLLDQRCQQQLLDLRTRFDIQSKHLQTELQRTHELYTQLQQELHKIVVVTDSISSHVQLLVGQEPGLAVGHYEKLYFCAGCARPTLTRTLGQRSSAD